VVGFFLVMSWAIPGFTKPSIPPIGTLQPFTFTTQDGRPFTEQDMQGKVAAVHYFFTTCSGICPRMNNNMRNVYDELKERKRLPAAFAHLRPGSRFRSTPETLCRFDAGKYSAMGVSYRAQRQLVQHGAACV
jgi:hypothetical protein